MEFASGIDIEVPRRFIGEDNLRTVGQRAGYRDPLLFPSRKLFRPVTHPIFQTDIFEELFRSITSLAFAFACDQGRNHDIFEGREIVEEIVMLENEADMAIAEQGSAALVHVIEGTPVNLHFPFGRFIQTAENMQQSRFTDPGMPYHSDHISLVYAEFNPFEDRQRTFGSIEIPLHAAGLEKIWLRA